MKNYYKKSLAIYLLNLVLMFSFFQGCSVKFVADYDAKVVEKTLQVATQIDRFYSKLLLTDISNRGYSAYASEYIDITVEIKSLLLRTKVHPLNENSTSIVQTILKEFEKNRDNHKKNNTYKDVLVKIHEKRFTKLFTAMLMAENSKQK